jgi:hypothetical protein
MHGRWTMGLDRWHRHGDLPQRFGRVSPLFFLCALVVVASLILGGGARGGYASDAILQLIAVPLLCLALWRLTDVRLTQHTRVALVFCLAVAALPLLQLLPLPAWLSTALPNRDHEALEALGLTRAWMPLSVSPHKTWLSALGLIAPLAIFLGVLLLPYRERRWLSLIIIAVGTVSVFIGLLQVAQGPESPLRFFDFTNQTEAVGFFANRNHFAALGYALVLLAAAWAVNTTIAAGRADTVRQYDTASIVTALGCLCLLVVLLAGEAMARSRAGLGLTMVAVLGAFALGLSDRRVGKGFAPNKILGGATLLAVILAVQYALYRILERFEADPLDDARLAFVPATIEAAKSFLPLGSGLGTFVPVYASFEKPEDTLFKTYANRAHNDAAELLLETGVFGLALIVLFVSWFIWRSLAVWRTAPPRSAQEIDRSLARAATIIIALILIHSLVDYPLRTGAIAAVMAFSCALLIEPIAGAQPVVQAAAPTKARRRRKPKLLPVPVLSPTPSVGRATAETNDGAAAQERWGSDIQWPEEWRKDPSAKQPS